MNVLFVCMGNICRSPLAEGLFQHHVDQQNHPDISCASAGTIGFHVGNPPDERSIAVAKKHGIDISHQRSQKLSPQDFHDYDYIIAMDRDNLRNILTLKESINNQSQYPLAKVDLLLAFAQETNESEVPDPYYGGDDGFQYVYDMVFDGTKGLLEHILAENVPAK